MENKDKNDLTTAPEQDNAAESGGDSLKRRIMWWAIYAGIGAMLLVGIYLVVIQYVYVGNGKPYEAPPEFTPVPVPTSTPVLPTEEPSLTQTPEQTPEPTPEPEPILPVQITFSKSKIQCDIEPVGRDGNAVGTVDSATIAAWFNESAAPNQSGNCVINGHVSFEGKKGSFAYLKEMEQGEEVVIKLADDTYRYYEVYSIDEYPYDDVPAYFLSRSGRDRVTLITCKGDFDREADTSITRVLVVCMPKSAE